MLSSPFFRIWILYILIFVLVVWGFNSKYENEQSQPSPRLKNEHLSMSVLWQKTSGEAQALSYQAYALAKLSLEMQLKTLKSGGKKPAIVTDIDETLLDNSPAFAKDMFGTRNSEVVWQEWIASGKADAKAGALKFLMYAQSKGVEVFYITNRSTDEKALTLKALQMLRVPNADSLHLFMKTDTWNKEPRRMEVAKKYNILLLIGDNLNDFSEAFFFKSPLERRLAVDSLRREFGSCFIVLPNPMDGDWESALYGYEKGLSETVKAQKRYEALKSY